MTPPLTLRVRVNGRDYTEQIPPRLLLTDFLRARLGLTGTHVGCEHGVCGACTVHLDGTPVRACLLLAIQADSAEVTTVEGLAPGPDALHPVQEAFRQEHGLQCGFCTPGMLMTVTAFLREHPHPTDDEIRREISGNLCRCTGYHNIVRAVRRASELLAADAR
jgi:carbon-monoxide dehydrogenase small subunit